MSKKHFIALADFLHCNDKFSQEHIEALATFCQTQNPNFKRERWIAYINGQCGPNGGKR